MNKFLSYLLIIFFVCSSANAEDRREIFLNAPKEVSSVAEIKTWVETYNLYGYPESKIIPTEESSYFIIWNLPYSGRDTEYVYIYHQLKDKWILVDTLTKHGPPGIDFKVNKEDAMLILFDMRGSEFKRLSLKKELKEIGQVK